MISERKLSAAVSRAIAEVRHVPAISASTVTDRVIQLLPAATVERAFVHQIAANKLAAKRWVSRGRPLPPPGTVNLSPAAHARACDQRRQTRMAPRGRVPREKARAWRHSSSMEDLWDGPPLTSWQRKLAR
jgi:hypothetical protein